MLIKNRIICFQQPQAYHLCFYAAGTMITVFADFTLDRSMLVAW